MKTTGDIREKIGTILKPTIFGYPDGEFEKVVQKIVALIEEEKKTSSLSEAVTQSCQSHDEDLIGKGYSISNKKSREKSTDKDYMCKCICHCTHPRKAQCDAYHDTTCEHCVRPKPLEEKLSKCCSAPIITRGDTETRGSTCWYECSKCGKPCDEKPIEPLEEKCTCSCHISPCPFPIDKCAVCDCKHCRTPEQPEDEGVKAIKKYGKLCAESFNEILAQVREEAISSAFDWIWDGWNLDLANKDRAKKQFLDKLKTLSK